MHTAEGGYGCGCLMADFKSQTPAHANLQEVIQVNQSPGLGRILPEELQVLPGGLAPLLAGRHATPLDLRSTWAELSIHFSRFTWKWGVCLLFDRPLLKTRSFLEGSLVKTRSFFEGTLLKTRSFLRVPF